MDERERKEIREIVIATLLSEGITARCQTCKALIPGGRSECDACHEQMLDDAFDSCFDAYGSGD